MKITSKNLFKQLLDKDKALDERERMLNRKSMKLSANKLMEQPKSEAVNAKEFFKMGFIYGIQVSRYSANQNNERRDGPKGFNRLISGVADYFTADLFDFDKRGGLIGGLWGGNRRVEGGPVVKGETY